MSWSKTAIVLKDGDNSSKAFINYRLKLETLSSSFQLLIGSSKISIKETFSKLKKLCHLCWLDLNWFGQFLDISTKMKLSLKKSWKAFQMKFVKKWKSKSIFKQFSSIQNLMKLLKKLDKARAFLKNGKKSMIPLKEILSNKLWEDGTSKSIKKFSAHLSTWRMY